ncbi:MAG: 3'(2'),5'-bisphosphate nucleotidase CysQ [Bacilli bacterium]
MYESILREMIKAVQESSLEIMRIYKNGFDIRIKSDESPVTDADIASDKIIRNKLSVFNEIAWLSEEDADDLSRLNKRELFIIDPLDGTQDFCDRDGSFGINVAYVIDHKPVVTVIGIPRDGVFAYAVKGQGSFYVHEDGREEQMHVSDRVKDLIMVGSRTHELPEERAVYQKHAVLIKETRCYGASLKAVYLAMGIVDASIRYTKMTKEWDVCAPDLIVKEAGGIFCDTNLKEFNYNRADVYNRDGYCMFNRKENTVLLK